jgi:archaemetzincin
MIRRKIYLLPMGTDDIALLGRISSAVEQAFDLPAEHLSVVPVPSFACDPRRRQYNSTSILKSLYAHIPPDALRILAVVEADLFIPQLNYVFGEAAVDGLAAVISLRRLHPEFYGEAPDDRLFAERAAKEAVHELGHTFGLHHCPDPHCVMFFSNNIADTDRKSAEFRGECAEKLRAKLQTIKAAA